MKTLLAMAVGTAPLLAADVTMAQIGNMMNGGGWGMNSMGGYVGIWGPILLVVAAVGVVAWLVKHERK